MNVQVAIKTKRAVRQYTDRPVSDEAIRSILNAGRLSQSSKNSQPWEFIVVKNRDTLKQLAQTGDYAGHLQHANMAIVLVSKAGNVAWTSFDLGQAAANMQLAAWELGVGSCIAAIYRSDDVRRILSIPEDYDCRVALAFGFPHPDFRPAKMGGRRTVEDVVHWEGW